MKVSARFDGVPPNMSVRMRTPASARTRSIACAMSSLASVTSSCQPIETAAKRGRSPTIISAALRSSVASCPWVTTTTPITDTSYGRDGAPRNAMTDAHGDPWDAGQRLLKPLGNHHRAVASAGAADGDSEVRLSFGDVVRHDVLDVFLEAIHELARRLVPLHEIHDRAVPAGALAQRRHEMRIRQAADVERQVRVHRQTVLIAEAQQRQHEL